MRLRAALAAASLTIVVWPTPAAASSTWSSEVPFTNQVAGNVVTGCGYISTGSQNMPPSWTNNTDPNVAFDTQGRAYQVTLPFNAFWTNLHPNSNIGIVYSDDLGRTWHLGNGGRPIEAAINSSL